ncbi:hypothetical protein ABIC08_003315 [Bradyrhizobium sp. RT9b]
MRRTGFGFAPSWLVSASPCVPGVVRAVVHDRAVHVAGERGARAAGGAVGILERQVKAAHEAAPADALVVEQVADVLACHQHGAARARAGIVGRVGVADQRQAALAVGDRRRGADDVLRAIGLAGNHRERALRRRTESVGPGIVAHGEVLGVIPEGGGGVAVEIAHDLTVGAERTGAAGGAAAGEFRKQVFLAVVHGLLLGRVGVVLRARVGLGAVEAERIRRAGAVGRAVVRIVHQQMRVGEIVDLRRMRLRHEGDRARRIGRVRIGREVMIERAVLVEDDHEMLDRRLGVDVMRMTVMITVVIVVATLIMPVIAVTAEVVRKDGKSARERARGRDNRSRRQ